jgi:hypothetical protein
MCSPLVRYVRAIFPDSRSRTAALLVGCVLLALSLYWLFYTIQTKWLDGHAHPQQIVTYEPVSSLPSFFGHRLSAPVAREAINQTIFKVMTYWKKDWYEIDLGMLEQLHSDSCSVHTRTFLFRMLYCL